MKQNIIYGDTQKDNDILRILREKNLNFFNIINAYDYFYDFVVEDECINFRGKKFKNIIKKDKYKSNFFSIKDINEMIININDRIDNNICIHLSEIYINNDENNNKLFSEEHISSNGSKISNVLRLKDNLIRENNIIMLKELIRGGLYNNGKELNLDKGFYLCVPKVMENNALEITKKYHNDVEVVSLPNHTGGFFLLSKDYNNVYLFINNIYKYNLDTFINYSDWIGIAGYLYRF